MIHLTSTINKNINYNDNTRIIMTKIIKVDNNDNNDNCYQ